MPYSQRLAVTVTQRVSQSRRRQAEMQALRWDAAFVDRSNISLRQLTGAYDAVIVFEQHRVRLVDSLGDTPFHVGMAKHRILRILRGESDPLIEIGEVRKGHRVVDATFGFGRDALVAAIATGSHGEVVGLEASHALYAFADEGIGLIVGELQCTPVHLLHADSCEWMASTTERFDLAILDPMFVKPKRAEPGFEMLRRHAVETSIDDHLLEAALRVASRVIVKVGDYQSLHSLKKQPTLVRRTNAIVWARYEAKENA